MDHGLATAAATLVLVAGWLPAQGTKPRIHVMPADADVAATVAQRVRRMAAEGVERLRFRFPRIQLRPIRIVLHSTRDRVPEALRGGLQPKVPGFARLGLDEIHLVLGQIDSAPPNDLRTTIDHELVHVLLDQFAGRAGRYVPRWFHEGLAQFMSEGIYLGVKEEDLVSRIRSQSYIPFDELRDSFPHDDPTELSLAYGQSLSFVTFLEDKLGLAPLLYAAQNCSADATFASTLAKRIGKGLVVYELEWRDYVLNRSGAGMRFVLSNCFLLIMVIVVGPLLALAVAKRRNREELVKRRMLAQERAEQERARALFEAELLARGLEAAEDAEQLDDRHDPDSTDEETDDWPRGPV